jgi:uncharacterized ParB-like nuclease family protein
MRTKDHLLNFTDAFSKRRFKGSSVRGLQAIPVNRIIGSVNRSQDYYFDFTKISEGDRTRDIEKMMARGECLPPIDVFQVGDYYYVEDGHHRVAIAKKLKQEFIDAYVTQYFFWSYEDYFKHKLGFADVICSRPLYYKRLLDDIRDLRAERYGEKYIDFKAITEEWYRDRYIPAIEKINSSNIAQIHPRLPADFYCRYLRLKRLPRFAGLTFDDILEYMMKRYKSPFYLFDRTYRSIFSFIVRLMKKILKQQPVDDIHPSA